MPPVIDTLLHPQRTPPPPIDVDLARVMGVGTGVWGVALVVMGVLWRLDMVPATWVWVAAAAIVLGLLGLLWARRNGRLSPDGTGAMLGPATGEQPAVRPDAPGTPPRTGTAPH